MTTVFTETSRTITGPQVKCRHCGAVRDATHEANCGQRMVTCKHCHVELRAIVMMKEHMGSCADRPVRCEQCHGYTKASGLESHQTRCAHTPVTCKHCGQEVLVKDWAAHREVCVGAQEYPNEAVPMSPVAEAIEEFHNPIVFRILRHADSRQRHVDSTPETDPLVIRVLRLVSVDSAQKPSSPEPLPEIHTTLRPVEQNHSPRDRSTIDLIAHEAERSAVLFCRVMEQSVDGHPLYRVGAHVVHVAGGTIFKRSGTKWNKVTIRDILPAK